MSFRCETHGWTHLIKPCPACPQNFVTTSSSAFSIEEETARLKGIEDRLQEEIANLNSQIKEQERTIEYLESVIAKQQRAIEETKK